MLPPLRLEAEGPGSETAPELVLLHGMGYSSRVWEPLFSRLRKHFNLVLPDLPGFGINNTVVPADIDQLLNTLIRSMPKRAIYMGWSLGGILAIKLAGKFPNRISALITCSTSPCYTEHEQWKAGWTTQQRQEFGKIINSSDAAVMRRRMAALSAFGDRWENETRHKLLQLSDPQPSPEACAFYFDLLCNCDLRRSMARLNLPMMHLLGEQDAVLPVASLYDELRAMALRQRLVVFPKACHALFISHAEATVALVKCFATDHVVLPQLVAHSLDRGRVANSFSSAARNYDQVALFQKEIGAELLEKLPVGNSVSRVLDLGCGTGYYLQFLHSRYPEADILALDLAFGMVQRVRERIESVFCCCGDAERLPIAANQFEIIFSNLALQWCDDPGRLLREIYRILRPGGYFLFSTFMPETLWELRSAWRASDEFIHVHQFVSPIIWQCLADDLGLCWHDFIVQNRTRYYPHIKSLMRELKTLGAHNSSRATRTGLTPPSKLVLAEAVYEEMRQPKGLPATFQVLLGVLQKP